MDSKREVAMLELVYEIDELIQLQEVAVGAVQDAKVPQLVTDFQEDLLRVLKFVQKLDFVNIDKN